MKIICLSVGKRPDKGLAVAIEDYQKRLRSYCDFSFEYIQPADKNRESEVILRRLKADDYVVLLDENGKQPDNPALSAYIEGLQQRALKRLIIVIGGAYGVNEEVKRRSDNVISLSALVFPHQIVRLLLVEQLYRSFNLLHGGKYHHS